MCIKVLKALIRIDVRIEINMQFCRNYFDIGKLKNSFYNKYNILYI